MTIHTIEKNWSWPPKMLIFGCRIGKKVAMHFFSIIHTRFEDAKVGLLCHKTKNCQTHRLILMLNHIRRSAKLLQRRYNKENEEE